MAMQPSDNSLKPRYEASKKLIKILRKVHHSIRKEKNNQSNNLPWYVIHELIIDLWGIPPEQSYKNFIDPRIKQLDRRPLEIFLSNIIRNSALKFIQQEVESLRQQGYQDPLAEDYNE